jgi:hypothetical protein
MLQPVVFSHEPAVAAGCNGQIAGRIADFGKLPIDDRRLPLAIVVTAVDILQQKVAMKKYAI